MQLTWQTSLPQSAIAWRTQLACAKPSLTFVDYRNFSRANKTKHHNKTFWLLSCKSSVRLIVCPSTKKTFKHVTGLNNYISRISISDYISEAEYIKVK